MKLHRLLGALAVASACGVASGAAWAETNLVESIWISDSADCPIQEIRFYDFGQALVKVDKLGSDEASWSRDSAMVHVTFKHWNGNLDGPVDEDTEFKAIYTWRSEETLVASTMPCPFRRK